MTVREKNLLIIFIILCILSVFFLRMQTLLFGISEHKASIKEYTNKIENIEKRFSESEGLKNEKSEIQLDSISSSEIADTIIKQLKENQIIPLKYQILNESKGVFIEVSIKCSNLQLVKFFKKIHGTNQPYTINNINLKTEAESVSALIKFSVNPSSIYVLNDDTDLPVEKLFRPALRKSNNTKQETVNDVKKQDDIEDGNDRFSLIGRIKESDGQDYIYLKSIDTNRVLKISTKQIVSEESDAYIFIIDGKKILINKGE